VLAVEGGGLLGGLVVQGWIADRLSPQTLLLGADALLAGGVAVLSGFVLTRVTELELYAIVAGANGVSTAMVNSALSGLIQALVPASQRQRVNGIRSVLRNLIQVGVPALSGILSSVSTPALALAPARVLAGLGAGVALKIPGPGQVCGCHDGPSGGAASWVACVLCSTLARRGRRGLRAVAPRRLRPALRAPTAPRRASLRGERLGGAWSWLR